VYSTCKKLNAPAIKIAIVISVLMQMTDESAAETLAYPPSKSETVIFVPATSGPDEQDPAVQHDTDQEERTLVHETLRQRIMRILGLESNLDNVDCTAK
jgi:copper(I)-binding protein